MNRQLQTNAVEAKTYPVLLGVDDGELSRNQDPTRAAQLFEMLEKIGARHVNIWLNPITDAGDQNSLRMVRMMTLIDQYMRQHGITYTFNVEAPNFRESAEITPGIDEFDHPGGLHRWDLRMEWLSAILPPAVPTTPAFSGVVYDECEHMQLSNNKYSNEPTLKKIGREADFDKPFLVNTHGTALESAYDRLVAECCRLREEHYKGRVPLSTEQVWPDLFHIFARAGWTIGTKLLKEHLSSVTMSIALGAAVQYQDRTRLWVSPDLWRFGECPGHSAESLRSALLMSYWLGAETIYVESLRYRGTQKRHPDAVKPGVLIHEPDNGPFELTAYGRVYRDFALDYVPKHPRPVIWSEYRPRVALVRLPDGGWGQQGQSSADESPSRNRLLGNREHPLDDAASEWLYVWPVLTHQTARPGAISIWNGTVYPERLDFFVPIDSVAVFDHLVEGPVLDSVECFVVCGHALSAQTFKAIKGRVAGGATCIIARRLYDLHAGGPQTGMWVVVDSFRDPAITRMLAPFLGPPDRARFRFARHTVEFTKGDGTDRIEVRVTGRG